MTVVGGPDAIGVEDEQDWRREFEHWRVAMEAWQLGNSVAKGCLVKKLAEVMKAAARIPKRGHNNFHNYDFATEADIAEALRGELADRSVMLIPSIIGEQRHPVGEKGSVLTVLDMEMEFIDGETGESIKKPWKGYGTDKEDKGGYKAMTGGEKYFLLKTFLLPTGDDPEHDTKQPPAMSVQAPSVPHAPAPSPARGGSSPTVGPERGDLGTPLTIQKVESQWEGVKGKAKGFVVLSSGEELAIYDERLKSLCEQLCQDGVVVDVERKVGASGKAYLKGICRTERQPTPQQINTVEDAKAAIEKLGKASKPLTDADIPFAWLLALLIPALLYFV